MKAFFSSKQNKANCTFGGVSSCAFSAMLALGTVLAVSIFVFAIISYRIISIIWIIALYFIITRKISYTDKRGYSQNDFIARVA